MSPHRSSLALAAVLAAACADPAAAPLDRAEALALAPSGPNDGLVTAASARHGVLLATIPADHFDEVGQILGTTALAFDHRAFYRRLARYLTDPAATYWRSVAPSFRSR